VLTTVLVIKRLLQTLSLLGSFAIFQPAVLAQSTPDRIVSTTPSITEILFDLGLGDRVVGVSNFCSFPPRVLKLPKVGTYLKPDIERIARLKPSLVILQPVPGEYADRLKALRIPYLSLQIDTLNEIYNAMIRIGEAANARSQADQSVARLKQALKNVEARAANLPKRRVLLIIGRRPGTLTDIIAVGGANYLDSLTSIAGGINVLAQKGNPAYLNISMETVIRENPDVIIDLTGMEESEAQRAAERKQTLSLWQRRRDLAAVTNEAVYSVSSSTFVTPGPRAAEAAEQLFKYLHSGIHK
jgi:iron complex transport system substrate-binding protein